MFVEVLKTEKIVTEHLESSRFESGAKTVPWTRPDLTCLFFSLDSCVRVASRSIVNTHTEKKGAGLSFLFFPFYFSLSVFFFDDVEAARKKRNWKEEREEEVRKKLMTSCCVGDYTLAPRSGTRHAQRNPCRPGKKTADTQIPSTLLTLTFQTPCGR